MVDGPKGFLEAVITVFPLMAVRTCINHLIRNSLAVVLLERAQADHARSESDLPGRNRRNSGS
ncbi:MAG: transposase [Stellaceae bacterium]